METEQLTEPERDAEIERQLFGREVVDDLDSYRGVFVMGPDGKSRDLPHYHRDITAAWLVVGRILELGLLGSLTCEMERMFFESEHYKGSAAQGYPKDCPPFLWLFESAAPEAICRAALKVVADDTSSTS